MSLASVLAEMKKSGFMSLYDGDTLKAFRARIYDEPTRKFMYYDFTTNMLSPENANIIKSKMASFPKEKLVRNNGMLMTQSEINGGVIIEEVKDNGQVNQIVSRIFEIQRVLEVS